MHPSILRSKIYFTLFFILSAGALAIFYSCNTVCSCKTVQCPAYTNVLFDSWFPYDSGQINIFESAAGIKDTLAIGQLETSSAYDAKQGCYSSDNGCSAWKDISSFGKMNARYFSSADWNGKLVENHCSFQLYDFRADGTDISDTGIVFTTPQANCQSQYFAVLTLNGKPYNNLQLIKRDSSGLKESIYKVYIAKDIGLVAYEYYPAEIVFMKK